VSVLIPENLVPVDEGHPPAVALLGLANMPAILAEPETLARAVPIDHGRPAVRAAERDAVKASGGTWNLNRELFRRHAMEVVLNGEIDHHDLLVVSHPHIARRGSLSTRNMHERPYSQDKKENRRMSTPGGFLEL